MPTIAQTKVFLAFSILVGSPAEVIYIKAATKIISVAKEAIRAAKKSVILFKICTTSAAFKLFRSAPHTAAGTAKKIIIKEKKIFFVIDFTSLKGVVPDESGIRTCRQKILRFICP